MDNYLLKNYGIAKKTAYLSLFCAAAIIFSYAEIIIPISIIPIPGFKIGFANIVILLTLYCFGFKWALLINIARCLIVGLLFSGISSALFSLCGGVFAILVMYAIRKCSIFSIYSVSIAGAVAHNLGQFLVAFIMFGGAVLVYVPWLMLCSILSGILIAILAGLILNVLSKNIK